MDTGSCSVHLVHGIAEEAIDREVCVCIISSSFGYFHTSGVHSETNKGSESPSTSCDRHLDNDHLSKYMYTPEDFRMTIERF